MSATVTIFVNLGLQPDQNLQIWLNGSLFQQYIPENLPPTIRLVIQTGSYIYPCVTSQNGSESNCGIPVTINGTSSYSLQYDADDSPQFVLQQEASIPPNIVLPPNKQVVTIGGVTVIVPCSCKVEQKKLIKKTKLC